jgi:hypothetical protein
MQTTVRFVRYAGVHVDPSTGRQCLGSNIEFPSWGETPEQVAERLCDHCGKLDAMRLVSEDEIAERRVQAFGASQPMSGELLISH